MKRGWKFAVGAALMVVCAAALSLVGCSDECKVTSDCGNYQFCVNSKCEYIGGYASGCNTSTDCTSGLVCSSGKCTSDGGK